MEATYSPTELRPTLPAGDLGPSEWAADESYERLVLATHRALATSGQLAGDQAVLAMAGGKATTPEEATEEAADLLESPLAVAIAQLLLAAATDDTVAQSLAEVVVKYRCDAQLPTLPSCPGCGACGDQACAPNCPGAPSTEH